MTINELMETLKAFQERGEGDLPVKIYADHGQVAMSFDQINMVYVEDSYRGEDIYNFDEVDEAFIEDEDLIRVILLEG